MEVSWGGREAERSMPGARSPAQRVQHPLSEGQPLSSAARFQFPCFWRCLVTPQIWSSMEVSRGEGQKGACLVPEALHGGRIAISVPQRIQHPLLEGQAAGMVLQSPAQDGHLLLRQLAPFRPPLAPAPGS